MSTDNPTYTAAEIGFHVPSHMSQTNTGSTEHNFRNPLYDIEDGPTNEYCAPWGTHSHTALSKPPHVKNYGDTPTTPTRPEKIQLSMFNHADNPGVYDNAVSPVAHAGTNSGFPVHRYDYAITKQPTYVNQEPGTLPPGVEEHYEMMMPRDGASHYEFGPN